MEHFPPAAKQLQIAHCGRCAKTILRFVLSDKNRFFPTPEGRIQRARNIPSQVAKLRQNSVLEKEPDGTIEKNISIFANWLAMPGYEGWEGA